MNNQRYRFAKSCPQCGQEDEEGKYKGARMGSTRWGHDFSCCSDECGYAFANNPKLKEAKALILQDKINSLKNELGNL